MPCGLLGRALSEVRPAYRARPVRRPLVVAQAEAHLVARHPGGRARHGQGVRRHRVEVPVVVAWGGRACSRRGVGAAARRCPRWNTPSPLPSRCTTWRTLICRCGHSARPRGTTSIGPSPTLASEAANLSRRSTVDALHLEVAGRDAAHVRQQPPGVLVGGGVAVGARGLRSAECRVVAGPRRRRSRERGEERDGRRGAARASHAHSTHINARLDRSPGSGVIAPRAAAGASGGWRAPALGGGGTASGSSYRRRSG